MPRRKIDPEAVRRLSAEGKTAMEIARELNVTSRAIMYWRRKLGLIEEKHERKIGEEERRTIEALIKNGATMKEVARELCVHYQTIRYWVKKLGLTPLKRVDRKRKIGLTQRKGRGRRRKIDIEKLRELASPDTSNRELAEQLGVSKGTVKYWRRMLNLPQFKKHLKVNPEEFKRLWESGMGVGEIAELLGIKRSYVSWLRKRLGLPPRRHGTGIKWSGPKVIDGITYLTSPLYEEYLEVSKRLGESNLDYEERRSLEARYEKLRKELKRRPSRFLRILEAKPLEDEGVGKVE